MIIDSKIENFINQTLEEDIGAFDATSDAAIDDDKKARFQLNSRDDIVVCGVDIAEYIFRKFDANIQLEIHLTDGDFAQKKQTIISGHGNAKAILLAERVVLNILRQLIGVATYTNKFVKEVAGTKAKILDTRKTIPLMRKLQKYAVKIGGGENHRFGLYDLILIKDNHIEICGGVKNALEKAHKNNHHNLKIEIECETIDQVKQAISGKADIIMLDNMTIDQLKNCVSIIENNAKIEASGNVKLTTVKEIAKTGVDYISVGAITNNPLAVDIGLDMDFDKK